MTNKEMKIESMLMLNDSNVYSINGLKFVADTFEISGIESKTISFYRVDKIELRKNLVINHKVLVALINMNDIKMIDSFKI